MPLIKQSILNAGGSFFRKIQKMDFESKELILLILTIYDPCVSLINRATDTIACVAWRFCRAGRTSGVVAPAPISSRFLYPRLPLLLSAPNQNRHATQATDTKMSQTKSHNVPLWLLHKRLAKDCQVRKI